MQLNLELEALSPDFWRFELEAAKQFRPKDYKTGKTLLFDLKDFIKGTSNKDTDFAFYLGSQTTPPCVGINNYYQN